MRDEKLRTATQTLDQLDDTQIVERIVVTNHSRDGRTVTATFTVAANVGELRGLLACLLDWLLPSPPDDSAAAGIVASDLSCRAVTADDRKAVINTAQRGLRLIELGYRGVTNFFEQARFQRRMGAAVTGLLHEVALSILQPFRDGVVIDGRPIDFDDVIRQFRVAIHNEERRRAKANIAPFAMPGRRRGHQSGDGRGGTFALLAEYAALTGTRQERVDVLAKKYSLEAVTIHDRLKKANRAFKTLPRIYG